MDGTTDPRWVAAARWTFIFIRHQLRIGHTLDDIEKMLYAHSGAKDLASYINTWELVNGEFRMKNRAPATLERKPGTPDASIQPDKYIGI